MCHRVETDDALFRRKRKANRGRLLAGDSQEEELSSEDSDVESEKLTVTTNVGYRIVGAWHLLERELDETMIIERSYRSL